MEPLIVGVGVILTLARSLNSFPPIGLIVKPWYEGICLVLLYLVLSFLIVVSWSPFLF